MLRFWLAEITNKCTCMLEMLQRHSYSGATVVVGTCYSDKRGCSMAVVSPPL